MFTTRLLLQACVVFVCLGPIETAQGAAGRVVHVAVTGDDRNPGTADEPVARLAKAYELARNGEAPSEIVIHGGIYEGGVALGRREDRFSVNALVLSFLGRSRS